MPVNKLNAWSSYHINQTKICVLGMSYLDHTTTVYHSSSLPKSSLSTFPYGCQWRERATRLVSCGCQWREWATMLVCPVVVSGVTGLPDWCVLWLTWKCGSLRMVASSAAVLLWWVKGLRSRRMSWTSSTLLSRTASRRVSLGLSGSW